MWNTNLKFLKDGEYLIELTYVFYKVDDRRNPWDIDDNVFGSQGYISFNDNIIESNLDFVYRNGYYSGLIEEPTVNGNNKVPLIHKALIPVTVVNGNCTIEDEHLQKTNVLVQDLTYKSTYVNNKYEVKYSSNNISFNWLINYKGINFNEYRQDFSNQFLYPKLDSGTTVNKGEFLLHLAIMCGWYDGTGNSNDWLMAFLLQYCIYPVHKDYYIKSDLNLDKLIDQPNKNDLLIALQQITTKEEFDKLFNSKKIKKMIVDDNDLMFAISRNDNILNIMYDNYKIEIWPYPSDKTVSGGKYILLETQGLGTIKQNGKTLKRLNNDFSKLFQYFKKNPKWVDYISIESSAYPRVYYYDFEI